MNHLKVSQLLLLPAAALLAQSAFAQVAAHAVMPSAVAPGHMRNHAWVLQQSSISPAGHGPGQSNPTCQSNGCYYFPFDILTAYAIPSIAHSNGGAGMVVAIVDAFYNPQTAADLNTFIGGAGGALFPPLASCALSASGSPLSACLTIEDQTGCSTTTCLNAIPAPGTFDAEGWALETDLDVQTVHALAPNAKILLIACNSDSGDDLYTGVAYAKTVASVVSNSWGGGEFEGENTFDSTFAGSVPVLFSSGDNTATEYPCTSVSVLCVGGTRLIETATSFRNTEIAWGGTGDGGGGGGCSPDEGVAGFQVGYSTCGSFRGVPDVSALADPATGEAIALGSFAALGLSSSCSPPSSCNPGFYVIGGTSLASPLTAAVIANIDADRVFNGKSVLGGNLNALIYQAAAGSFYRYRFFDVTTGNNGANNATTGWDEATGLGVSLGPTLAAYLLTTP